MARAGRLAAILLVLTPFVLLHTLHDALVKSYEDLRLKAK